MLCAKDGERDCVAGAQEVVQETFLRVWRRRWQYDGRREASITTWIHKIAFNVFLDYLRVQRVRGAGKHVELTTYGGDEFMGSVEPYVNPTQESDLRYADLANSIEHILSATFRRSPHYREVFFLCAEGGYTLPEIADMTGINLNTLKTAFFRMRGTLQDALQRQYTA